MNEHIPQTESTPPEPEAGPIFVVGAPRSGTSMLHWALVQHPRLWGGVESDFISRLIVGARRAYASGTTFGEFHWLTHEKVSLEEFMGYVGGGINRMYLSRSGNLRWVEQTPHYVCHYEDLRHMFPGAKFIHIVRDGRQVICSMQEMFGWSFGRSMRTWKNLAKIGNTLGNSGRKDFLQVQYETLVSKPRPVFKQIYDFIEESFDQNSVAFLDKPINTTPDREAESSTDKLIPRWGDWNWFQRTSFRLFCGKLAKDLGYALEK